MNYNSNNLMSDKEQGEDSNDINTSTTNTSKNSNKEEGEESDSGPERKKNEKEEGEESSTESSSENESKKGVRKKKQKAGSKTKKLKKNKSDSESSESESDDSDDDGSSDREKEDDSPESKLNKIKSLAKRLKNQLNKTTHKLEKINRALSKAQNENNKANIKKCKKYVVKYELKVTKIKSNIKKAQAKQIKYKNLLDKDSSGEDRQKRKAKDNDVDIPEVSSKKQKTAPGKQNEPEDVQFPLNQPDSAKQKAQPAVLKLPYPVLNDTRDHNVILNTLQTKYNEHSKKKELNMKSITSILNCTDTDPAIVEKNERNLIKLKQLDQALDSQQDKLLKQLDYIKLSLNIQMLRDKNANNPVGLLKDAELINKMRQKLNEMYMYMKNENKAYILKQKQQAEGGEQATGDGAANQAVAVAEPKKVDPMDHLNSLYEKVNNALAALLAHTAAVAHAQAGISAYNYMCYYYQQQQLRLQNKKPGEEIELPKPVVPLKTELEKASTAFSLLKDKISNFFSISKSVMNEDRVKPKPRLEPVKKLIVDYDDDDEEKSDDDVVEVKKSEEEIKPKTSQISSKLDRFKKRMGSDLDDDDEDEDSDDEINGKGDSNEFIFNDLDKNCDLEIITTSEIRSGQYKKKNYLLPSLKALNFPLKASLEFNMAIGQQKQSQIKNKVPDTLIAVEKSKCGLTFLGTPSKFTNSIGQRQNKLNDILFTQKS